jgi:predicted CoA-binding protein
MSPNESGPSIQELIDQYMESGPYAVVGASTDRAKFGNKVLRAYLRRDLDVHPVNPKAEEIEGRPAFKDLASLPEKVRGISVITPPRITEAVVEEAARAGIEFVWMQPGAESDTAIRRAGELGLKVIADGSCFLALFG